MTTLQSISHTVAFSLDLDEILNNVIRLLKGLIWILLSKHLFAGGGYFIFGRPACVTPDTEIIYEIPIHSGVIGRTARKKETQFIHDVSTDSDFLPAAYEVRSEIAVPLIKDNKVLGVLNVESKGDALLTENDVNVFNTLAGSVAVAIDNARLHAEVKTHGYDGCSQWSPQPPRF